MNVDMSSLSAKLNTLKDKRDELKDILQNDKLKERTDIDWNNTNYFNELVPLVSEIPQSTGIDTSAGTAVEADIRDGKIAYVQGREVVGTMEDYSGTTSVTPASVSQTLSTGGKYVANDIVINTDANLKAENIIKDITIFGVTGSAIGGGTDTSDGTATASDILKGKTAYVQGQKIIGLIEDYAGQVEDEDNLDDTNISWEIIPGVEDKKLLTTGTRVTKDIIVKGDEDLIPENIISGANIFGVIGTATGGASSDNCTATTHSIMKDRTAVVKGFEITGVLDLSLLPSLTDGTFGGGI